MIIYFDWFVVELPRYVRVNTIKCSLEEVVEHFNSLGFQCIDAPDNPIDISNNQKVFWEDKDLSQILVFPCGTDLHADTWVAEGKLMLQDKASCLSAIVLLEDCEPASSFEEASPTRFCNVIDACAAPGNKTTHAGALMSRSDHPYQLIAVDKDDKRVLLLKQFTERAGADVRVLHQSFLDIDSTDSEHGNVSIIVSYYYCESFGNNILSRLLM